MFKYLEIVITSLTTILVAKKLSPTEMGLSMPVLLYITYANYLALGVNHVILKNYSRFTDKKQVEEFLRINLQYLFVVCLVNIVLAHCFLDAKYALLAAAVSTGVILKSFFISYFRVVDRIIVLNKNNLIFSVLFLTGTFFFVDTVAEYLVVWCISIWISLIIYFTDEFKFYVQIFRYFLTKPDRGALVFNLKEGVKLAVTNVIATFLLTSDRFIVNKLNIGLDLKGSYQLADFVGSAYYMVITTIIFYFYPKLIAKLRNEDNFQKKYVGYILKGLKISPFVIAFIYLISLGVAKWIFPEYKNLPFLITASITLKTVIIFVTSFATFYVAMDKENLYVKSMIYSIVAILIAGTLFVLFGSTYALYVGWTLAAILLVDVLFKLFYIHGKK